MAERQWAEAATDFFEAFKNYDEAGNQRRIQCLKYVIKHPFLVSSIIYNNNCQQTSKMKKNYACEYESPT